MASDSATRCSSNGQFLVSSISLVNSCEPMPTHMAPALNQAVRLSSFGSTPPVIISCNPGTTGIIDDIKPGPSTDPGNTLITSAPFSLAVTISVSVAQPGNHSTLLR